MAQSDASRSCVRGLMQDNDAKPSQVKDGGRLEGHHPCGRQRNTALSIDACCFEAAAARLRQADDLLSADDADAGGHPRRPAHLHT